MKYMGSKRLMLQNGLGELILEKAKNYKRFVDLFCGASAVSWFTAENTDNEILAIDIQSFAVILAKSIICRNKRINPDLLVNKWIKQIEGKRNKSNLWQLSIEIDRIQDVALRVRKSREICSEITSRIGPIWKAYGGHYFSPSQSLTFDYLLKYLPSDAGERAICLAAIVTSASKCAAAPGHTAQPFQPTATAGKYLFEAWQRDPIAYCKQALYDICPRHAQKPGTAYVGDALEVVSELSHEDLVFVDPPYSGVQYSRFYHVLETLAKGQCGPVEGVGRYPSIEERPQSPFSNKGQSKYALTVLLENLSRSGCTVIFTFPNNECSNGLSGKDIISTAKSMFKIDKQIIKGKFSTLGGNNNVRDARKESSELIILMHPR
jgi:adenine-specific DNA-methyltransferase